MNLHDHNKGIQGPPDPLKKGFQGPPDPLEPTERFTGLAKTYAQHRPDYPAAALDLLVERCQFVSQSCHGSIDANSLPLLVDVGSGTGISARLLAARGVRVLGIEPNEDMRFQAEQTPGLPGSSPIEYRAGQAEATGLPAGIARMVLAAQAFHWFEPAAALEEFHRILEPGGWVALIWNERDETEPFTHAFGEVMRSSPAGAELEQQRWVMTCPRRARSGTQLLTHPRFRDGATHQFPHHQELDQDGVLGRAFSVSYAPREPDIALVFAEKLQSAFARYQQEGKVLLRYITTLYLARRPLS